MQNLNKKEEQPKEEKHSNEKDLSRQLVVLIESNNQLINRIDKLVSLFEEASKHVN